MTEDKTAYCEINLDALENNLDYFRKRLSAKTKIAAVIKSDAYGHGASRIASRLEQNKNCWGYCVANIEEAIKLRDCHIEKSILVLGKTSEEEYEDAIKNGIRLSVDNGVEIEKLAEVGEKLSKNPIIHIQVNTGMNRFGVECSEAADLINKALAIKCITVEFIYTHPYMMDSDDGEYTSSQYHKLLRLLNEIEDNGCKIPIRHYLNSGGVLKYPEYQMDMVRTGILLYGIFPSRNMSESYPDIQQVMSVYAQVQEVRDLHAGETVSYGGFFKAETNMRIAVINIGYANGYPRNLWNQGYVLIGGEKSKILGTICMNQMIVDVSHIRNVKEFDTAVVVGSQGDLCIRIEDIAELSNTIGHEIALGFGNANKKYFV